MRKTVFFLLLVVLILSVVIPVAFGAQDNTLQLHYDDRKDLSELLGKNPTSVQITDQNVVSKVAGTQNMDANVLVYENGTLYAVGCGTATLTVDGTSYSVTVSPAPLSIFMITGHSIGAGEAGNAAQSVVCEAGQAYSTIKGQLTSASGGLGYGAPTRATSKLDAFAPGGGGAVGINSGLAWKWNQLTGEKVWVLNMAISGSCLNEWQPGTEGHSTTWRYAYDNAVQTYSYAQQIVKNEIAAGHYTLGNMAIIYHNGANFTYYPGWTMESVEENYETMWSSYKTDLALDMDGDGKAETVEALGMISSWRTTLNSYAYDKPAGYFMSASADYPELFIASNATRDWLTEEGLELFPAIEYTTQSKAVAIPESILHTDQGGTSDNSLFCATDKAHLSQVTYNAVGIDAATNLHTFLRGEKLTATSVEFKNINLQTVTDLTLAVNEEYQLIPLTTPIYGQNVTFEATGGLTLSYPLQIKVTRKENGTVIAKVDGKTVATVNVTVTEDAHSHCECGGQAVGVGDHSCEDVQNWIPWGRSNGTSLPINSGYYYLVEDLELSAGNTIALGQDVHLCLNGHTVTSTARLYSISGNLSLTDCSEEQTGTLISSSTTNYGAVFYSYQDSVFDLYGGTLTSTGTNLAGAIGTLGSGTTESATMNMYGGKLTGGTVTHRAGNLYVIGGSVLNMYGGTIENGTTDSSYSDTSHGGNIYISGSTVNIKGGTVTGGSTGLLGGNIYLASGSLNISGGTVTRGSAENGGNIAVASGKTATISGGTISDGTATTYGGNIYTAGGTIKLTGGTLSGGEASTRGGSIYLSGATLTMTGGTVEGGKTGTAGGNIAGYDSSTVNISGGTVEGGNATTYGGNISLAGKTTLNVSGTAVIKDGFTGTSGTTGSGGNIFGGYSSTTSYSTINIQGGTISGGRAKEGGNIKFDGNGYITGGTISGGTATSGGSLFRTSRTVCELVISNGTVTGGSATNGGNIYVYYNGRLTVNGGLITKGTATTSGGNIYGYFSTGNGVTTQSIITIAGGTISDGTATTTGGNIEFEGTGIISGGTISGGNAETGGNIYLDIKSSNKVVYSSLTMSGGLIIGGNAKYGGNIQVMADFTMSGGNIENGTATSTGGNIRVYRPATFTLIDGTISGGSAPSGGNIVLSGNQVTTSYAQNAGFVMEGGTVTDGVATNHGGNVYILHFADMTMSGGVIENGRAGTSGGNIAMYPTTYTPTDGSGTYHRPATLTMTGGTISGGNASRGGNICIRYDASSFSTVLLSGTIKDGTGARGGNIYLANRGTVTLDGATVIGGSASETGDSIYCTRSITEAGTTELIVKGDTVLSCPTADLYVANSSNTSSCYVDFKFEQLSGKDKIIRVKSSVKNGFASADADYSNWIICADDGYKASYANGKLSFVADTSPKTVEVYQGTTLQAAYSSFGQAAEVTGSNEYIKLLGNTDAQDYQVSGTLWVDLNGFDLSNLVVSGTLYGMDSATDDYTAENAGTLTCTVTDEGQVASNCKTTAALFGSVKRYLSIPNEGSYSFHRFYMGITKVTLKPATTGVGYKAVFAGSDTVKNYLTGYGYTMWVNENSKLTKSRSMDQFVSLDEVTLRIDNILTPGKDEQNAINAEMDIYGNVFMKLPTGEVIESAVCIYNFREVIEMVAANYAAFGAEQQQAVEALHAIYTDLMVGWDIPDLHHGEGTDWVGVDTAGFKALLSNNQLNGNVKVYLTEDVKLTESVRVMGDANVSICLNGHTLHNSTRMFNVYGTLNIFDCCDGSDHPGKITSDYTSHGPVMYTYRGSIVNLYGGELVGTKTVPGGGVIALGNDASTNSTRTHDTIFNMYGGKIYGGTTTATGGNITAFHGGSFNMYGGEIYGGNAGTYGGNLYASSGTSDPNPFCVNLYGGKIWGGTATSNGGNIYLVAKTELHIYNNAVIQKGTAVQGGNIYALSKIITMDGGLLDGGRAQYGGNIAFSGDVSATLENGTLSGGHATSHGGNMYVLNTGNFTLNGMTLAGGTAENDGGNLYIYRNMYGDTYSKDTTPVVTLHNTMVTGGTAGSLGGGIYNMEGNLTLSGSTSVNGNNGSNLYLDAGQTVTLQDLHADATVGVTMGVAGKVSANTEFAGNIASDNTNCTVATTGDHIILQSNKTVNVPSLNGYSVGWHRGIVTSPFPVPLDGMGKNVERMNTYKVVSELEASMVVFADEDGIENAILLCTMDTIVIPQEFSSAIAAVISDATGIPADRIFISGTHTHAGVSLDENIDASRDYLQWLYPLLAEYAVLAVEDLAPVSTTQMIRTNADGMTKVRRYVDADGNAYSTVDGNVPTDTVPETDPDTELQGIRFVRYNTTGKDDVILVNFQSHPGHDASASNGNVSAEMWGTFRESVESQMPNTVCGFFIGASGNQSRSSTTDYVSADGNTYNLSKKAEYGAALAAHLVKAFENPTAINTGDFDLQVAHYAFQAENWYKSSFSGDKDRPLMLNAVAIGDFAFVTAPYEMFHENGEQLKDFVYENDLFDLLFVITNSNGSNKYIASYGAFENDETDGTLTSFEVRSTRFSKGIAEALITCHAEMLAQLSGENIDAPDFLEEAKNP